MSDKKTTTLNPFSVFKAIGSAIAGLLMYVVRYFSHSYTAVRDSWNDGKNMRTEIESSIRSFGIDPAQNWPTPTARILAVIGSSFMLIGRLFLGLFRALSK